MMDKCREKHLTYIYNLSLFSQKDEVITLQPFVSLSLSQRAAVSLIGKRSPHRRCFVIARGHQIYSDVSLLLSMNSKLQPCFWGGGCEKQHSPLPSSPSSLPLLRAAPIWISICTDKWKQTRPRCVFQCQIHFQRGSGSGWNYVTIARNNWERRQKWRYTEIIIITLKDLQWQRDESQQGLCVIAGQIVPSIDCAEDKKTTASENVSNLGMSVGQKG